MLSHHDKRPTKSKSGPILPEGKLKLGQYTSLQGSQNKSAWTPIEPTQVIDNIPRRDTSSQKPASLGTSSLNKSHTPSSETAQARCSTPSRPEKQHVSSIIQQVPATSSTSIHAGKTRLEGNKDSSQPGSEAKAHEGTTKHSAGPTQVGRGEEQQRGGAGVSKTPLGRGGPTKERAKRKKDADPIDTNPSDPHSGRGTAQTSGLEITPAPGTTLLALLSCRKHERLLPHPAEREKKLTLTDITRHSDYKYNIVSGKCSEWTDFTFKKMVEDFPFLHKQVAIPQDLGVESPGFQVYNEGQLHASLDSHLFRYMRQYLRITFDQFRSEQSLASAVPVTIRDGHFMKTINQKKPDFGVYNERIRASLATENSTSADSQPVNRMIIEVKPSWKWDHRWWNIGTDERTKRGRRRDISEPIFYTALSQLHYYMANSSAAYAGPTYGVLLTDKYLVPVKRDGAPYGKLWIAPAVAWTTSFEPKEQISGFTVQSALWYLSMLASRPGWHYSGANVLRSVLRSHEWVDKNLLTSRAEQERDM